MTDSPWSDSRHQLSVLAWICQNTLAQPYAGIGSFFGLAKKNSQTVQGLTGHTSAASSVEYETQLSMSCRGLPVVWGLI